MPDTTLCGPCKSFLDGTLLLWSSYSDNTYRHHETRKSFAIATKLGCEICTQLYAAFRAELERRGMVLSVEGPDGTTVERYTRHIYSPYLAYEFHCKGSDGGDGCKIVLLLKPISEDYLRPSHSFVSRNTGDENAIAFLKNQYESCLALHDKCAARATATCSLPTRLIDVGTSAEPSVRLCESADILSRTSPYAVLSHCWGSVQPLTLTKSSVAQLYQGVALNTLPLTFQHAVVVTRNFNLRYLWIDSLCIFQDDLGDWQTQANCMRDVYRNSAFCIAATAAQHGGDGLFCAWDQPSQFVLTAEANPRTSNSQETLVPPGIYSGSINPTHPYVAIETAPLNCRAWVAQERYLSQRIMHFTGSMLFWECQSSFTCETHWDLTRDYHGRIGGWLLKQITNRIGCKPTQMSADTRNHIYNAWYLFRQFYSDRNMTKESDVFVALRGIALDVSELLDDSLVFGLWTNRLIRELNWMSSNYQGRPTTWRAPSWSWASLLGTVVYVEDDADDEDDDIWDHQVEESLVEVLSYPTETNNPADWRVHVIRLRCRLIPLHVEYEHIEGDFEAFDNSMVLVFNGEVAKKHRYSAVLCLDGFSVSDRSERKTLHCQYLILEREDREGFFFLRGLLVAADERGSQLYNRTGTLRLNDYPESLSDRDDNLDKNDCLDEDEDLTEDGYRLVRTASNVLKVYEMLGDQEIGLV